MKQQDAKIMSFNAIFGSLKQIETVWEPDWADGLSANFKDLPFQLWFFDAAYGILSTAACLAETGTGAGELPASLTLEIPKAVVPVNCKHIAFRLDASFAAGACAGTIAVSEPQLSIFS